MSLSLSGELGGQKLWKVVFWGSNDVESGNGGGGVYNEKLLF